MADGTLHNLTELDALSPEQRIYVIQRAKGRNITEAAALAGITRQWASTWNKRPEIQQAIQAVQEHIYLDPASAVEHIIPEAIQQLEKAVKKGKDWAIKEVLDRRYGKSTQRQELTGKNGGPIETKGTNDLSDTQLIQLAEAAAAAVRARDTAPTGATAGDELAGSVPE